MVLNFLCFNDPKTEVMVFGPSSTGVFLVEIILQAGDYLLTSTRKYDHITPVLISLYS